MSSVSPKNSLYPPTPYNVPIDLAVPSPKYRFHANILAAALATFFLIYFLLLVFSGYLIVRSFTGPIGRTYWWNVLVAPLAILVFLFLVKGFFKRGQKGKDLEIEIFREDQPRLFAFIDQLCDEVGAPRPGRVYVNPEVNAAASFGMSVLDLFLPTRKNLLIGLGLVNFTNLTEFKALLGHEFGHMSQKSMRLGMYVYSMDKIAFDLVYGLDRFDYLLEHWRRKENLLAIPGWVLTGVIWVLMNGLGLILKLITLGHLALVREMEYHADLVAVSVTGSDAPVHLLHTSVFADACLNQAIEDLVHAADHELYTSDMFFHQSQEAAFLRRRERNPGFGLTPPLPPNPNETIQLFKPEDTVVPAMWLDHPTHFDREKNAKKIYIRSNFDTRPAWLLFDNPQDIRERVTCRYYRLCWRVKRDTIISDPEEVQAFVDAEHSETTYDQRYHGFYDHFSIAPGNLDNLMDFARKQNTSPEQLSRTHANLYTEEVKERVQKYLNGRKEADRLLAVVQKQIKPENDEVEFRGNFYDVRDARKLWKKVEKELAQEQDWFAELDQKVFQVHYQMAWQFDRTLAVELEKRYRFHLGVQEIVQAVAAHENAALEAILFLNHQHPDYVHIDDFRDILSIFRQGQQALAECLARAQTLPLPPLKNMQEGEPLGKYLLKKELPKELRKTRRSISGRWINKLLRQMGEIKNKATRIQFKSLGGILNLQEKISRNFLGLEKAGRPR